MKIFKLIVSGLLCLSFTAFGQTTNPFDGFRFMSLPTTHMPIGSIWNVVSGPLESSVPKENIITSSSYSNLDLVIDKNLKTNLELGILNYLKLNGGNKSISSATLSLNKLERVTLNSIDVLKSNIGNQVLYEGIRVGEISFIVNEERAADAQIELLDIFKNINIESSVNINNKAKIIASGMDLFIAYRVIEIENAKQRSAKLKFNTQGHVSATGATLSSTYEANTSEFAVQICPCRILNCMKNYDSDEFTAKQLFSNCARTTGFDLTVILKNKIDMGTGKPSEFKYIIKDTRSGSINNYNQAIYNTPTSNGLEVSYLNFERLVFEPLAGIGLAYMVHGKKYRNVSLVKASYKFKNIVPTSVPGW